MRETFLSFLIRRKIFFPFLQSATVVGIGRKESQVSMSPNSSSSDDIAIIGSRARSGGIKLKYFCAGILLFNLVYGIALFVSTPAFGQLFMEYSVFFGLYALSIISATFGLYDRRDYLLYPYLIMTFPFAIIAFLVFAFHLTNSYYCAFLKKQANTTFNNNDPTSFINVTNQNSIFYDCSFISPKNHGWAAIQLSALTAFTFLFISIEKLIEFYCFRQLQLQFHRIKYLLSSSSTNHVGGTTGGGGISHISSIRINEILKDEQNNDSDDDMIIYDRNPRNFNVREFPIHDPPFGSSNAYCRTIA